ncbi:MAG TPA: type VI secretion system tube protein Hcp [Nitrosopumilaceae archaeon]|nr:type VI secretion system tube protein Hcp [Nitrosopumilaceae archaeon]
MKKIILFSTILLIFFGATFVSNAYSAQSDYYLKLDGIDGSATVAGESGWIKLYTVQYRETDFNFRMDSANLANMANQMDNPKWTVTKQVDISSPGLFDAVATGKHIKEGIMVVCVDDKCGPKILLSDVSVIGFSTNSTDDYILETVVIKSSSAGMKQDVTVIPSWIKNNAKWWSEGTIEQSDFTKGIQYMIQNEIMQIPNLPPNPSGVSETKVPSWIKNNAKWWSEGQITDDDFVKGIKYLVEKGIIKV